MLVLSRKIGERVVIGGNITVTITRVGGNRVTLGIGAPESVRVVRGELVGNESLAATPAKVADSPSGEIAVPNTAPHPKIDEPTPQDFYPVGVEMAVGRLLSMPDNSSSALVQGRRRLEIIEFTQEEPFHIARARRIYEPVEVDQQTDATMRTALELFQRCVQLDRSLPEEAEEVLRGVYANQMVVSHTREEFLIDFLNVFPPEGVVNARVIVSPGHLKRMIRALQDNLDRHEQKFGPVEEAPAPRGSDNYSN